MELEKNGHFVTNFGYLRNKDRVFGQKTPQIEKLDRCTFGNDNKNIRSEQKPSSADHSLPGTSNKTTA